MSKHTKLAAFALLTASIASAQQEVMVSQYMFNGLLINPAYAGSHGYVSGSLLSRDQWVNIEGAPRTSVLAADGAFWGRKMGLGITLVHDRIGISRDMEMAAHYAYRIRTGSTGQLAFGIKAGLSLYSARFSDLVYWDADDQVYTNNISDQPVGKFGFGIFWHNDLSFIGLSVPTLYAADQRLNTSALAGTERYFTRHFYLHAGHVIPIGEYFDLKPSTLIKLQPEAPPQADINLNVLYRKRIWLGAGYRTGDALVFMAEYQITPHLRVGYAYDMTTSRLRAYGAGSHEVMLGIDLGRDLIKIKTPRYF